MGVIQSTKALTWPQACVQICGGVEGGARSASCGPHGGLQEFLAYQNPPLPRNLQLDYAYGLTAVLGGGCFLMSEVTLHARFVPPKIGGGRDQICVA